MRAYSIIRDEEYKRLKALSIDGDILDLGGNKDSEYHPLIQGKHRFTSVNIDSKYGCDMVFDIQEKFPLHDGSFDGVLSMNVFEHIYSFRNPFTEAARILRKGGVLVFAVPFMHHIHGCPDDYMRYTKSTLEKLLLESGFKTVAVKEIGSGLFALNYQTVAGALPGFSKPFLKKLALSLDRILLKVSKRYRDLAERIPLGYFAVAYK
jgi:SAM-dependent methyltransferase